MNDTLNAWGMHCTAELARHISESVAELLPDDLHALGAGLHVLLEKTPPNGAPRAVRDFQARTPADFEATPLSHVASDILSDLQDEVATYLHRPWPTNDAGAPLHAWAGEKDGTIELAFRGEGVNTGAAAIELPPFPVPPKPESTVYVG